MHQLSVVEHQDMRVLTTAQLADAFDTNTKIVTRNFQRNQDRYIPNEHYFSLSGEDLKVFKASRQNDDSLKYVSVLYLWTEKGAWLHAKSLNSDRAWDAYRSLIDTYYKVTAHYLSDEGGDNSTLALTLEDWEQVQHRLEVLEMQIQEVTLHSGEQRRLRNAVSERVYELANEKGARAVLFRTIYSEIRERYGVGSYRDVRQCDLQDALKFIENRGR